MNTDSELSDFIKNTLNQIDTGIGKHFVGSYVKFEIAVAKKKSADGKIGIEVMSLLGAKGEGSISNEKISKVYFEVRMDRKNNNR